jgi:hypothetical protein
MLEVQIVISSQHVNRFAQISESVEEPGCTGEHMNVERAGIIEDVSQTQNPVHLPRTHLLAEPVSAPNHVLQYGSALEVYVRKHCP